MNKKMTRNTKMILKAMEVKNTLRNKAGEGYVDSGVAGWSLYVV